MIIWPIQDDQMNMTKKFEHDQKIHTVKHYPLNLTENISQEYPHLYPLKGHFKGW